MWWPKKGALMKYGASGKAVMQKGESTKPCKNRWFQEECTRVFSVYSRERLRRVLRKKTSAELHLLYIFTSSPLHNHVLTYISAHLHICTSTSLLIFTSSHLHLRSSSSSHIYISAHLHICTSTSLLIFTSSHLHLSSSSSSHIYISAPVHICTSTSLLIFTSSHLQLTSSPLALLNFLS